MNDVQIAFRQLSFSIKLENYIANNYVDIERFDIDLNIINGDQIVILNSNEFSIDTLKISSQININICFGAAALVLWKSIEDKKKYGGKTWPDVLVSKKDHIAGLIYSIRCCFAHNPSAPTWELKPRYRTIYLIGNKTIDLRNINNYEFSYSDIGGYDTLWLLKDIAIKLRLI